jgi:superfamily II DNA/RNA helicase
MYTSPISPTEQATAIKVIALEQVLNADIRPTPIGITIVVRTKEQASSITIAARNAGWYNAASIYGSTTDRWYVNVPYNMGLRHAF